MMPREMNGVVSPELIVYGTKNLRVSDLSVMPLHIASHTQSTFHLQIIEGILIYLQAAVAYTVGEKGQLPTNSGLVNILADCLL
jgi:GMC oxidoreductase